MRNPALTLAACSCAALLASCSILSKEPPVETRWFEVATRVETTDLSRPLDVGVVTSAESVGRDMVWRRSEVEVLFDSAHRWADAPTSYVTRALEQQLANTAVAEPGADPLIIDVEIERFGGAFGSESQSDRAEVVLRIRTRGDLRMNDRVTGVIDLADDAPETLAVGLGQALSIAVGQAIEKIEARHSLEGG